VPPGQVAPGQVPARPPSDRAGAGLRILVALAVLAFLFAGAVMALVAIDLSDGPLCKDVLAGQAVLEDGECFDVSKAQQVIGSILLGLSAIAAAVVILSGIAFVIRGRGGRLVAIAAGAAIVLGALGLLIG